MCKELRLYVLLAVMVVPFSFADNTSSLLPDEIPQRIRELAVELDKIDKIDMSPKLIESLSREFQSLKGRIEREIKRTSRSNPYLESVLFPVSLAAGVGLYTLTQRFPRLIPPPLFAQGNTATFNGINAFALSGVMQPWWARSLRNEFQGISVSEPEWKHAFLFGVFLQSGLALAGSYGWSGVWCGMSGYTLADFVHRFHDIRERSETVNYLLSFLSAAGSMIVFYPILGWESELLHLSAMVFGAVVYESLNALGWI
ncbi:hypothetical protein [Parendozoicomonas haliclonae]|uniref:Rhomboid family protein n=1 Tax=Parendozoicomonas haliclonae TaxID=1960125 RepID=A0A1X7APJ6_9GAMM|nr:hypothetical protein [Parendozoicomonas haliclonae]SMA50073.1 hypothetical protein EHSB41UT_03864 [Parendozoicomonas haliclonae]